MVCFGITKSVSEEVAIELQVTNAEIPGIGCIGGGSSENYPEIPEGKQSVGANYRPRGKLTRFTYTPIVFMDPQIRPALPLL